MGTILRMWCPAIYVSLTQLPQRWPGLGPDGTADAEAEPPRSRPHPALVCIDAHSLTLPLIMTHLTGSVLSTWNIFVSYFLSQGKQTEPDAVRTENAAPWCLRLKSFVIFWPFGVFGFLQGKKPGLITSRHTLTSPLYSKCCFIAIVTVHLVKKRAVKLTAVCYRQIEQQWGDEAPRKVSLCLGHICAVHLVSDDVASRGDVFA